MGLLKHLAAGVGVASLVGVAVGIDSSTIIETQQGLLQGITDPHFDNVTVYRGIPFAGNVSGEYRWTEPRDPAPWTGVKVADTFGPMCYASMPSTDTQTDEMSEDCLNLIVWTAAKSVDAKLPVYMWIHGGRWQGGANSLSSFDGAGLASKDIIVVTIQYRMGVLGFLATDELQAESQYNTTGNYAILDEIQALKWLHANIAAFGGDPEKITIGGQSSGAGSVYQLVNSPLAKGLFRGAISESGIRFPFDPFIYGMPTSYRNFSRAMDVGSEFMANINASSIAEARTTDINTIMEYYQDNEPNIISYSREIPPTFRPTLDGVVMPGTYWDTLLTGFNDVVQLNGYNSYEAGRNVDDNYTVAEYEDVAEEKFGDMKDEFLELFPASTTEEATTQIGVSSEEVSRVGMWLFARERAKIATTPMYHYYWSHPLPGVSGAEHSSEIIYAFNNLYANTAYYNFTATDYAVGEMMSSYWSNFIKDLNPNGEDLVYWPASGEEPVTMHLDETQEVMEAANATHVEFFTNWFFTKPVY